MNLWASQVALVVKNPPANAGDSRDVGSIPGSVQNCKRINLCCFRALSFVVICSTSNRKLHVLHIPKEKKKPNNEIIMIFNNSQHLLAPSLLRPLYFFLSFLLPFSFFPLILHLTNAGHPCASHSQSPQQSPGSLTSTNVPQQEIHFFL